MGANASNVSNSKIPGTLTGDGSRANRLTGRTLAIARLVWITLSLLVAGLFIWALILWNLSQEEIPFSFLMPFGYFVTGLVIFRRKSDDLMGLLSSLMLIFFGPYLISGANIIVSEQPGWEIIGAVMVSLGSLNETIVHPREVFKAALLNNSCALILLHNHPSGDSSPSGNDKKTTERLVEAGKVLGIRVLDHVIVAKGSIFSFKENGLI